MTTEVTAHTAKSIKDDSLAGIGLQTLAARYKLSSDEVIDVLANNYKVRSEPERSIITKGTGGVSRNVVITWAAPPPQRARAYQSTRPACEQVAHVLKERPGEWARVFTESTNAYAIRNYLRELGLEAVARSSERAGQGGVPKSARDVYARYNLEGDNA